MGDGMMMGSPWDYDGLRVAKVGSENPVAPKGGIMMDNALQKIPEWWSKRDLKTPLPLEV